VSNAKAKGLEIWKKEKKKGGKAFVMCGKEARGNRKGMPDQIIPDLTRKRGEMVT